MNKTHPNCKLQKDFDVFGLSSFEFSILELIEGKKELITKEQEYLNKLDFQLNYNIINSSTATQNSNEKEFVNYINKKWLVPKGMTDRVELNKYKIYKDEDKEEIIRMVVKCKLLKLYYSQITFNKVITLMQDSLGYTIESSRIKIKQKQYTYKLIIDFDEEKINIEEEDTNERYIQNN